MEKKKMFSKYNIGYFFGAVGTALFGALYETSILLAIMALFGWCFIGVAVSKKFGE